MAAYGWRASFYFCAALSFAWVALWALSFTEHPREHPRITKAELAALPEPGPAKTAVPWTALFRRMLPVTIVYFCYGWTLWLYLSWIPQYFLHSHALDLKKSALFASSVFFAGVVGDTLGGVLSDRLYMRTGCLRRARSGMVAACMSLSLCSLVPLLFTHDLFFCLTCLSAGFFFAEMTIGPMWAIPMDIAPEFSGTASGLMNTGSALAAIISPVVSGALIDKFHNWELPFAVSIALMCLGVGMTSRMRPERRFQYAPVQ
jgi:MFS family permease